MSRSGIADSARRTVLKALGAGAAILTAGSAEGATAGTPGKRPPVIDENLGYTQWDPDERVPFRNKVDHTVTVSQQRSAANDDSPDPRVPAPAEFYFDPVGLQVEPGDVVEFSVEAGHHAISAYHPDMDRQRRMPADAPSFSSPMLGGYGNERGPPEPGGRSQSWFYQFETEGVYDMYCPPHEVFGMVMRIVVGDTTDTGFGPTGPQFLRVLEFSNEILAQSDLEPESIVEEGSVAWDDLFPLEGTSGDGE